MLFKRILSMLLTLILMLGASPLAFAQPDNPKSFKVVAYCSEIFPDSVETLPYDKLTHVIYAFLIPGSDGSLIGIEKPEKLKALVAAAHAKGVKVSVAVGGWSYKNVPLQGNFEKMAGDVKTRKLFVRNTVDFLKAYNLDGLDLDWEFPTASAPYEALVRDLNTALDAEGMFLSAALNGAWSETGAPAVSALVTDACLEYFDFINVMAYDADPTGPGHSPLWFAETSIRYWAARGVPQEKIIIGVPFYGAPGWVQYRDIIKDNPENAWRDRTEMVVGNWGKIPVYYNGVATIQEKTRMALMKAGGVMIFDVNEDTQDATSLTAAIDEMVQLYGSNPARLGGEVHIVIGGKPLVFSTAAPEGVPYVDRQSRLMVPLRRCLEAIGATVSYNPETRHITAEKDGIRLNCTIGERRLLVNGSEVLMDTEAVINDSRTYVPVRFIYEAFGKKVSWHGNTRTVVVE